MPLYVFQSSETASGQIQQLWVFGPPPGDGTPLWQLVKKMWVYRIVGGTGGWTPTYYGLSVGPASSLGATHTDTSTTMTLLASFTMPSGASYSDYIVKWYASGGSLLDTGRQIVVASSPGQHHDVYYTAQDKGNTDSLNPGFNRDPGPVVTSPAFAFINSTNDA